MYWESLIYNLFLFVCPLCLSLHSKIAPNAVWTWCFTQESTLWIDRVIPFVQFVRRVRLQSWSLSWPSIHPFQIPHFLTWMDFSCPTISSSQVHGTIVKTYLGVFAHLKRSSSKYSDSPSTDLVLEAWNGRAFRVGPPDSTIPHGQTWICMIYVPPRVNLFVTRQA